MNEPFRQLAVQALEALEAMKAEFRALDLPHGSKAYAQANTVCNSLRTALFTSLIKDSRIMFTVEHSWKCNEYDYVQLLVHCNLTTYRRKINEQDRDLWEVLLDSGRWETEFILNEIVTECFSSVQA